MAKKKKSSNKSSNKKSSSADNWLGEQVGDATREDVLEALRQHVLGTVMVFVEASDGSTMLSVSGTLVEADRDPDTWERAEQFALIGPGTDPQVWHLDDGFRKELGERDVEAAANLPVIPKKGIEQYVGVNPGASGYRFDLGGGAKLALVLWQDALHIARTGDLAPGMGGFGVVNGEIMDDE
jgi:hypothetical protein